MAGLGTSGIMLILCVILLFVDARKLPELTRGLGKGIREFKEATQDSKAAIHDASVG